MKKTIVVLSGAGISQESGIATFRDSDGLWENHSIEDVATPQGFKKNPALVLDFYNKRREQLKDVKPNQGHLILARLEKHFNVEIITQNVDDLHERAGSTKILHLHGELKKMRSVKNPSVFFDCENDIILGDLAADGGQLRPHIVWFNEDVPLIEKAVELVCQADFFVVVGTSLQVYPAAGLTQFVPKDTLVYVIDPNQVEGDSLKNAVKIIEKATIGLQIFEEMVMETS